jgi:hypothetical protein
MTTHSKADIVAALTVAGMALAQLGFGVALIASCELRAKAAGACNAQWAAGQALLFGGTGTAAGLATRNPLLRNRRPEDDVHLPSRDTHGRFTSSR